MHLCNKVLNNCMTANWALKLLVFTHPYLLFFLQKSRGKYWTGFFYQAQTPWCTLSTGLYPEDRWFIWGVYIRPKNQLTPQTFGQAHAQLIKHILQQSQQGIFRKGNMFVISKDGKIEYVAETPECKSCMLIFKPSLLPAWILKRFSFLLQCCICKNPSVWRRQWPGRTPAGKMVYCTEAWQQSLVHPKWKALLRSTSNFNWHCEDNYNKRYKRQNSSWFWR